MVDLFDPLLQRHAGFIQQFHLLDHAREKLENDPETVLLETSTDSMTFLAGIHQNYSDSVTTVLEAWEVMDSLSYADYATRSFNYTTSTIHRVVAIGSIMGIQHTLPSISRSSKIWYPASNYKKRAEIMDAVEGGAGNLEDVRGGSIGDHKLIYEARRGARGALLPRC